MMPQQTNIADSQLQLQQWMFMQYPSATMVMQHPHYHRMIPYQLFPPQSFIPYPSIPHHRQQSHQGSSSEENRTIWVGDLHYWMQENYLYSCFAHTGEVASIKVIRNKKTGQSKGYGFVEFWRREAAEKVLQTYNGYAMPYAEQPFSLNWASFGMRDRRCSDSSIFVGNLASDVTDTLFQGIYASKYPSVRGAKVVINANTGRSKGYGFVRFGNDNERSQAVKEMNGVYFSSRPMRVGVATSRKPTGFQQMPSQVSSMKKTLTKWEKPSPTPAIVLDGGKEETNSSLPDDLIVYILTMLPAKSILRFRCVCKYWCKLFDDPKFIKTHLKNGSKFNCLSIKGQDNEFSMLIRNSSSLMTFEGDYFEAINMMELPFIQSLLPVYPNLRTSICGSCNGLILMENLTDKGDDINLYLWNPTTKEYKKIVGDYTYKPSEIVGDYPYKPSFYKDLEPVDYEYGLGYDCEADDYKIVKANPIYYDDSSDYYDDSSDYYESPCYGYEFQVYTLSSGSWKRIHNIFPYKIYFYHNAFVNGALHWIATPCPYSGDQPLSRLIVSFDIRGETLEEVPLTPQVDQLFVYDQMTSTSLGVLAGCLCVVSSVSRSAQVWVMKDHKVRDSWTRLFVAQIPVEKSVKYCCMILKWEFKNGKVLFEARSGGDDYFLLYDYKSEVSKIYHIPEWNSSIETYAQSLVSISGTYAGKQELSNYHKKQETRKYHLAEKAYIEKGLDLASCQG